MKACLLSGALNLQLSELPDPEPGPGQAVVRLGSGGICGSDLHYYSDGGNGDFRLREPLVLGHEVAGEVVAVGREVKSVKPGDRVAVNPNHPCGHCRQCRAGRRNLCQNVAFYGSAARFPHVQGAFAEFFLANEENCHVVPRDFPYRAAACAEPLAVALHALEQAGSVEGKSVFISGSGPIGVLLCAAARLGRASRVCASDVLDEPLIIARSMGATESVNVVDQPGRIEELANGKGAFEIALEASGHPSGLATALTLVEPGGTIVQVGNLPRGQTAAPLGKLVAKEVRLSGSFRFDREYARAVEVLQSGQIDLAPMLTHEFTFADLIPAFATAADKRVAMKVSLRPS
jgi:L-idonate 5-dehydrogenase